jgi:Trypsin
MHDGYDGSAMTMKKLLVFGLASFGIAVFFLAVVSLVAAHEDGVVERAFPQLVAERNLEESVDTEEPAISFIIGGNQVPDGAYPWFGRSALFYSLPGSSTPAKSGSCGASLIHPRAAVSAYHCVDDPDDPTVYNVDIILYFGAKAFNGAGAVAVRRVEQIQGLAGFNFPLNDIVLYMWADPITNIDPIAFNRIPILPSIGTLAKAIGFGRTVVGGPQSRILLETDLDVVDASVCNRFFREDVSDSELVCVRTPGQDICQVREIRTSLWSSPFVLLFTHISLARSPSPFYLSRKPRVIRVVPCSALWTVCSPCLGLLRTLAFARRRHLDLSPPVTTKTGLTR